MKNTMSLVIATALLAVATAAFAYPSLAGPTGTGALPNAAVPAAGTLHVAGDLYDSSQVDGTAVPIRLQYGLGKGMEIGGGFTAGDHAAWNLNGKLTSTLPSAKDVAWGVGARLTGVDLDANDETAFQLYGVLSKDFHSAGADLRGSLGLDWTNVKISRPSFDTSRSAMRPFVSLSVSFPNQVNLAFDYQFENSDLDSSGLHSLVLRYPFTPTFAGEIGVSNMNQDGVTGNHDSGLFLGANYIFGGG